MIMENLLFVGSGLYLVSAGIFLYLWIKTLKVKDGTGLKFLKILTASLFIGSLSIFLIRVFSEYGSLDMMTARAIAIVNPITLVGVALYLNYLFHNNKHK